MNNDWKRTPAFHGLAHDLYRSYDTIARLNRETVSLIQSGDLEGAKKAAQRVDTHIKSCRRNLSDHCRPDTESDLVVDFVAEMSEVLERSRPVFDLYGIDVVLEGFQGEDGPAKLPVHVSRSSGLTPRAIMTELIRNAVHWCAVEPRLAPDGKSVDLDHGKPEIKVEIDTRNAFIAVSDSGPGVRPEDADAVFKSGVSFRTVSRQVSNEDPGGRGLHWCHIYSTLIHPNKFLDLCYGGYRLDLDRETMNAQGNLNRFFWRLHPETLAK